MWFGKVLEMAVHEWSLYKKGCSMDLQYNIGVFSEMFMNVVLPYNLFEFE